MANITTTEVNDSIATVIAAESLGHLRANTVLARLVRRDWDNEVARHGQTITIPFRGTLAANDKVANTPVTLQTPADTAGTLTLDKHKEVSFLIEDIARLLARPDYLSDYIGDALLVVAEQIDSDIAALYAGLSQSIDATTAGGSLQTADVIEARRLLSAAGAPIGERYAVIHEDAEAELLGLEKFTNQDYRASLGGTPEALITAYTGRWLGFQVYMDQKIAVAGGECKNLFFQKSALCLATRPLVRNAPPGVIQTTMDEDGMGLRVTLSYDTDHLGWKCTVDVLYGVAELRDNHGIVVRTSEV